MTFTLLGKSSCQRQVHRPQPHLNCHYLLPPKLLLLLLLLFFLSGSCVQNVAIRQWRGQLLFVFCCLSRYHQIHLDLLSFVLSSFRTLAHCQRGCPNAQTMANSTFHPKTKILVTNHNRCTNCLFFFTMPPSCFI